MNRADAKLDAAAFLIATLDKDCEGFGVLVDSLETREDAIRVVTGLSALAASLTTMAFHDPRDLVAQWAQMVAATEFAPPSNAEERRRNRGSQ